MQAFASRVVRPFLPQQHRDFYAQLPFAVFAAVDDDGWPWVSLLCGLPGFLSSPDEHHLIVRGQFPAGDPLATALAPGRSVGILGIELPTRRRNRLNATVTAVDPEGFSMRVAQSFGNCPQYIQTRALQFVSPTERLAEVRAETFQHFSDDDRHRITRADTFFVGSAVPETAGDEIGAAATRGVDASHRGGRPGFVKVDGNVLTVPEFPGNLHFNTLGNFLLNPRAGLCFPDFETGDLLLLSGTVTLQWDPDPTVRAYAGAERAWQFTLRQGLRLPGVLPLRGRLDEYSPNTLMTGDWQQAEARQRAEARRDAWRPFRVTAVTTEAADVRSFWLQPEDGDDLPAFRAGQYLTLKLPCGPTGTPMIRTYTVSSAPGEVPLRITVKRSGRGAPDNRVSASEWLHQHVVAGQVLNAQAPRGDFHLDAMERRPALLLAGGIGITPMAAMARHVARESLRMRRARPLVIVHTVRDLQDRVLFDELTSLAAEVPSIRYYLYLTGAPMGGRPGQDFHGTGRVDADTLRALLWLDDYDVYLCGPAAFVQAQYDHLLQLGVADARIHAEAFGPSSLLRKGAVASAAPAAAARAAEATAATVVFARAGITADWTPAAGPLLSLAEAQGLSPPYSCRQGSCGSCLTRLQAGQAHHRGAPSAPRGVDEVLLCQAVPAAGQTRLVLDL